MTKVFRLSLDHPLVTKALHHFNIREAFNTGEISIDELQKLTSSDIENLKDVVPDEISKQIAVILQVRMPHDGAHPCRQFCWCRSYHHRC